MAFRDYAREFDQISDFLSQAERDHFALIRAYRKCAARSGRRLLQLIIQGSIEVPRPRTPWLRFSLNRDDETIFSSFSTPHFESDPKRKTITLAPWKKFNFTNLVGSISGEQNGRDPCSRGAIDIGKEDFINRHVFTEATIEWLPRRYPDRLDPYELRFWKVTTSDARTLEFISDWSVPESKERQIDVALQLSKSYRDACRLLVEFEISNLPSKISPTEEFIIRALKEFFESQKRLVTKEIAELCKLDFKSIGKNLSTLKKLGYLDHKNRKGYVLTEEGNNLEL